jgi:hypothetical protein
MLNDAQHRHLSVVLQIAEERLLNLQRQLSGNAPVPKLLEIENDLTETERGVVVEKISELLRLIASLSERFSVTARSRSLRHGLDATLSIMWADLQDVKAKALHNYGEADPRLGEQLDPLVDKIADGLLEICRAIGSSDSDTSRGSEHEQRSPEDCQNKVPSPVPPAARERVRVRAGKHQVSKASKEE